MLGEGNKMLNVEYPKSPRINITREGKRIAIAYFRSIVENQVSNCEICTVATKTTDFLVKDPEERLFGGCVFCPLVYTRQRGVFCDDRTQLKDKHGNSFVEYEDATRESRIERMKWIFQQFLIHTDWKDLKLGGAYARKNT